MEKHKEYLFILSYFHGSKSVRGIKESLVVEVPIYATDIDQAIRMMNGLYAENGKGHQHKSLVESDKDVTLNGAYYPAQREIE